MRKKILLFLKLLVFTSFFISCADKNPSIQSKSQAVQMLIISPLVRINDSGFIHFEKNAIKIQVYGAGAGLFEMKISEQICINSACQKPETFNQKFFGDAYYSGLLADIISSKEIFSSKGSPNECGGFSQKISNIEYEVCPTKTTFKNKKTRIEFSLD